uniref:(northern house mosquito) hypothetical protein n=1 Tax=Culex pipiens TaxID=7175 RepID=A0A8D8HIN8_CULPI
MDSFFSPHSHYSVEVLRRGRPNSQARTWPQFHKHRVAHNPTHTHEYTRLPLFVLLAASFFFLLQASKPLTLLLFFTLNFFYFLCFPRLFFRKNAPITQKQAQIAPKFTENHRETREPHRDRRR